MNLDERMVRARDDYRALEGPERGVIAIDLDRRRSAGTRQPGRGRWLLAAAALVAVIVGTAVAATTIGDDGDGGTEVAEGTSTPPSTEPPPTESSSPSTTDVTGDPLGPVELDPAGPYDEGQQVTVRHPDGLGGDVRVIQCVEVEAQQTCGLTIGDPEAVPTTGSEMLRVRRLLLTPDGVRDCADDEVTCRFVVFDEEGGRVESSRLAFTGGAVQAPSLAVEPGAEPGTFTLRPDGLEPHPSWLDHPEAAANVAGFGVTLCAFGPSEPVAGPYGEDLWDQRVAGPGESACSAFPLDVAIDPSAPDAPVTVALPTQVYGYRGWSDCATQRCYLEVTRTVITDSSGSGWTERATAALLPPDGPWAEGVRPSLTIDTRGPHRAGQTITVTIAGLPAGTTAGIGICHVAAPWGCRYPGLGFELDDGTHEVPLPDLPQECGADECYLELDAGSEGLPPLATAPLDTPG